MNSSYIELPKLDVYKNSREYSKKSWEIYSRLNWKEQKIIGDQMIRSVDSVVVNIAEGLRTNSITMHELRFWNQDTGIVSCLKENK
ncbi:MAG: four helix bundle protein [Candidatus Magasanikbacteria bacterium]